MELRVESEWRKVDFVKRRYHDLIAWQRSIALAKQVYSLTERFPDSEPYGLVSQMRRAAVSVASNIAEGASRASKREFAQFLNIAKGSLSELETQLTIAEELQLAPKDDKLREQLDDLFGLLNGLINSLRRSDR